MAGVRLPRVQLHHLHPLDELAMPYCCSASGKRHFSNTSVVTLAESRRILPRDGLRSKSRALTRHSAFRSSFLILPPTWPGMSAILPERPSLPSELFATNEIFASHTPAWRGRMACGALLKHPASAAIHTAPHSNSEKRSCDGVMIATCLNLGTAARPPEPGAKVRILPGAPR